MFSVVGPNQDIIDLVSYAAIVVVTIVGYLYSKYGVRLRMSRIFNRPKPISNTSNALIMAYYTYGHGLMQLAHGKIKKMRYFAFVTTSLPASSGPQEQLTDANAMIYMLQLPFNAQAHIIGLSKKYEIDRLFLSSYIDTGDLEPVVLEGDFPQTYLLFTQKVASKQKPGISSTRQRWRLLLTTAQTFSGK